jgi:hypothetical protein
LKVLRDVSTNVRKKSAVLKAAREMTVDAFKGYLTQKHDQHLEPVTILPKVDSQRFDNALEMVMAVEKCNRAEALIKVAELVEQEYLVPFESVRTA